MNPEEMLKCIKESPQQLKENLEHADTLLEPLIKLIGPKDYQRIWLIASGSSYNAATMAKYFMEKYLNREVKIVTPMSFVDNDHFVKPHDLTIVISQSGCSNNALQALDYLHKIGHQVIALTGNITSTIKDHNSIVIDYGVKKEKIGFVTKGVVTLCLFLDLLALKLAIRDHLITIDTYHALMAEMNKIPTYHQAIQNKAISFYHKHQAVLNDMQIVYSCGIGASYGVALEAALKMGETIKVPSFAYESEEFLHGPNLQVNENYTLFLIDDNNSNSQRIKEIYQASKQLTTKTFLITNSEINDDDHVFNLNLKIFENLLAPIYIVPFFQILAYEITSDLKRWPQNPLMKGFKESLKIKTADIKKIYD